MRKFTPLHLHVVKLHWEGHTNAEIAARLRRSDSWVSSILSSPECAEIYKRLENHVLDTSIQVQTTLQAAAPVALSRKMDLMFSANDAVANKATQEILELSGHVPLRQIEIRRHDHIEEEFRGKSEADIRREILESLTDPPAAEGREALPPSLLH